jgi:phosphoglycerate kinase
MVKLSVRDISLKDKRVFVRVDFNVPLDEELHITDDTRIRASLPTIKYILEKGGIPVLASHLGRPKGKVDPKMSLQPVAHRLSEILKRKVIFAPDCVGKEIEQMAQNLKPGDIMLLENTRFHKEEKDNDTEFSRQLAALAQCYVNDAFGTAHRAHASVVGITEYFDEPACGFLMEKEIEFLTSTLEDPKRPLLAIIGGAKVSTKIGVIKNLLKVVDRLIIGGGMCFTFYKAQGFEIGRSLCEEDFLEEARALLDEEKIYLPQDVLVASEPKKGSSSQNAEVSSIPADQYGVDIGEQAILDITRFIDSANTIVWNGPMGIFEIADFARGTEQIAEAVARASTGGTISIVGGGDTIAALARYDLLGKITHASTGGGASLEFLEGKKLPGIEALKDK